MQRPKHRSTPLPTRAVPHDGNPDVKVTDRRPAEERLRESERDFRALANSIPQLAWMADTDGAIFWYNERWYEYTGSTLEEMRGWGWRKVHHPDHVDRVVARIREAFATGEPWEDTFPLRSRTGEYRWFLSRALPIKDAEGRVVRWFGTNTDVTEQRAATAEREELLERERKAHERVTTILESITDAFFALDREWRFTVVNRRAESLLRSSRAELVGKVLWDEFPDLMDTTAGREYRRAVAEQVAVHVDQFSRRLGFWAEIRAFPSPDGLSIFFRDVTEQRRAVEALRESEERFRALAEHATMSIFVIDEESTIEFANPAAERMFGYSIPELVGRSLDVLMPEDQRQRHHGGIERYLATGRRNIDWEGIELPGLSKDGRVVPLEISFGEFVRGGRHYFTGIARDITERKQIAEALRESEESYRLLADMVPQHIWTTDPDGYHSYFSRRWYEYTGATPEQTRGEGWLDLLHPDDRERTIARWQHSLRTGETYTIEYRFRRADGEYTWFLGQAMPLRNEAGEIVRWFGTLTDISDRKRIEEERERLLSRAEEARAEAERRRDELERVTESRARLMRGFSHDVRNPLGVAVGHLHIIREMDALNPKQDQSVEKARRSIAAALDLIDDLLELARAETGEIEIQRVPTDLRGAVRDAVDEYCDQAEAEGLALTLELPDELPAIASDRRRVRQVLGNLLSNAVKYTERGGVTVRLAVREGGKAPGPGPWLVVDVSDTGAGISPEQQRLLFQEFRRLDTAGGRRGTGIGLAISQKIAGALGGEITIDSEVGRGSTFTLWLPVEPGEEEPAAGGRGARAADARAPSRASVPASERARPVPSPPQHRPR